MMSADSSQGTFVLNNAASAGVALKSFPREFKRNFASQIDPRFTMIFGILFLFFFVTVAILSQRKVSDTVSQQEIVKIQERYAQLVLNQPKPKPPEVKPVEKVKENTEKVEEKKEEKPEEEKVDREKETFVQRQKRQEATREQRQAVREQVKAAVSTAGIFAAITSSGSGSGGAASGMSDLLGDAAGAQVGDIGNIKVTKGTFATKNVDVAELKARRGSITSGVDIAKENVEAAKAQHISSGGGVAINSAPVEVTGNTTGAEARSQASIKKVIDQESNRLKRVYETWLKRDPTLAGQVKIKFTVMPDGSVSNVSIVSSTTKNAEFDETLIRYVKRWAFSPVDGGSPVEVVYPFVFEAQT